MSTRPAEPSGLKHDVAVRGLGETPVETRIDLTISSLVSAVRLYHEKALLENLALTVCGWGKELINIETSAMGMALHVEFGTVSNCVVTDCIDQGDNAAIAAYLNVPDLEGKNRISHKIVDLGCYEAMPFGLLLIVR